MRKSLIQYNWGFYRIVHKYLKDGDLEGLKRSLDWLNWCVCKNENAKKNQSIWFKLHEDDTGAWTVSEIVNDLKYPNSKNGKYLTSLLSDCVKNASVRIYLS